MNRRRIRADRLLVARGQCESGAAARALILAGCVYQGEVRITKAGALLPDDTELQVRRPPHPWVSRGGIKLAHALDLVVLVRDEGRPVECGRTGFSVRRPSRGSPPRFADSLMRPHHHL